MRRGARSVLAAVAAFACHAADAQSMSPMRGVIASYGDEFALKVFPKNVYGHGIAFEMQAYDQDFRPIEATILPRSFSLPPGGSRPVTVIIGFGSTVERKVRVCAESVPYPQQQTQVKARICGRFLAQRLQ